MTHTHMYIHVVLIIRNEHELKFTFFIRNLIQIENTSKFIKLLASRCTVNLSRRSENQEFWFTFLYSKIETAKYELFTKILKVKLVSTKGLIDHPKHQQNISLKPSESTAKEANTKVSEINVFLEVRQINPL